MTTIIRVSVNDDVNYPRDAIAAALASPSEFADVRLVTVTPGSEADIYVVDLQQLQDAFGYHDPYGALALDLGSIGYAGLDVDRIPSLDPTGVAVHEIVGHLVAKLPDRYDADPNQTIMSGRPLPRLQADDIATLQERYAAPGTDDTMRGGHGSGTMSGGGGNDRLYGNGGDDRLLGNTGGDWLHGGQGNDWLHGGQGDDTMNGGLGADTMNGGLGDNTVEGFDGVAGDRIERHGTWTLSGDDDAVLSFADGSTVTLIGVRQADFQAEWVLMA